MYVWGEGGARVPAPPVLIGIKLYSVNSRGPFSRPRNFSIFDSRYHIYYIEELHPLKKACTTHLIGCNSTRSFLKSPKGASPNFIQILSPPDLSYLK